MAAVNKRAGNRCDVWLPKNTVFQLPLRCGIASKSLIPCRTTQTADPSEGRAQCIEIRKTGPIRGVSPVLYRRPRDLWPGRRGGAQVGAVSATEPGDDRGDEDGPINPGGLSPPVSGYRRDARAGSQNAASGYLPCGRLSVHHGTIHFETHCVTRPSDRNSGRFRRIDKDVLREPLYQLSDFGKVMPVR